MSDEEGRVGEALPGDADEGAERGDAGADDGHVGFEGGPDACVDVVPCRGFVRVGAKNGKKKDDGMITCDVFLLEPGENDDPDDAD